METVKIWADNTLKQSSQITEELNGLACPCCSSNRFSKNGKVKDNQRYICRKCGKHFRSTTGKTIHHIHLKDKIKAYIDCMTQGLSLRKTAKHVGISLQTAFRWRHRFLTTMQNRLTKPQHSNTNISTIVLPFSTKGKSAPLKKQPDTVSILETSATGSIRINVLGKHGVSTTQIAESLQSSITHITSKHLPHILKTKSSCKASNFQRLQAQRNKYNIIDWLSKFRGVSSKYLNNYWAWYSLNSEILNKNSIQNEYIFKCL